MTAMSRFAAGLVERQYATSRSTHSDFAASGEASRTKNSDPSSPSRSDDHRLGLAERL